MKKYFILLFLILSFKAPTSAMEITSLKDNKVIIKLDHNSKVKTGSRLFILNQNNQKIGLIKVLQTKNSKALGEVQKGTPQLGFRTILAEKNKQIYDSQNSDSVWGVLSDIHSTQMTIKLSTTQKVNLNGTAPSLKFFAQQNLNKDLSARAAVGYDSINVKGTLASGLCQTSNQCTFKSSYFALDTTIRYSFGKEIIKPWLGGGFGFLIPLSSSSNAIEKSKMTTLQNIQLTAGIDYKVNKNTFIPFEIYYAYFPPNNYITTTNSGLRIGYGLKF